MVASSLTEPSMCGVISKRLGIPMRQHHLSVFKASIKFRTVFTDLYGIREHDKVFFLFSRPSCQDPENAEDGAAVYMIVTHLDSPHAAELHYLSSNGITDRRLSIWRAPVCEMLRGAFYSHIEPYERNTCQCPSLRLSAMLERNDPFCMVFRLAPTRDLYDIHIRKR